MRIIEAGPDRMADVRELFIEYQKLLGIDLCFQNFNHEINNLPGSYAPPLGTIYLAENENLITGCVAIRPHSETEAKLKRLFVKPEFQARGIGRQLFVCAMNKAKIIGYKSVVLDTLPAMQVAQKMYLDYGFEPVPDYYANPHEGVKFFRYYF